MRVLEGSTQTIEVISTITPEEFEATYFQERKPVVITGLMNDWPAMQKWNVEYFREKYGKQDVWVSVLPNGLSHPPNREIQMNFSDFLDIMLRQEEEATRWENTMKEWSDEVKKVRQEEKEKEIEKEGEACPVIIPPPIPSHMEYYLQQSPVRNFPGLGEDYTVPDLFKNIEGSIFGINTIFIGSKGLRTTLHYDRPLVDNLFCQIHGEKRFRMWKPSQGRYFYPFSFDTNYGHVSTIPELDPPLGVDPSLVEVVDRTKFPLYYQSEVTFDIVLEAGDMLYIPKGYWHHVMHQSHSISMNFWYY